MKTRIMFLRDERNFPVGCLAIRPNFTQLTVDYQYSVLNPADEFNRSLARQIALGRLIEKPITTKINKESSMNEISYEVMSHLASNKTAPTRAVKAAKRWLNDVNYKYDNNG